MKAFPNTNTLKTLVIGGCGFIGKSLLKAYQHLNIPASGTHYKESFYYKKLDLCEPNLDSLDIQANEFSHAIISAGFSNVFFCEKNPQITHQINVRGTLRLIEQLCERNIVPVLCSSSYVFDGILGSYEEAALVNPLNEYGKQKAELEREISLRFDKMVLLLRLGKVFGLEKGDGTLLDEMIKSLLGKKKICAAYDQIFCPIAMDDLIAQIVQLQKINARGLYHVCGDEVWSRLDLAKILCQALCINPDIIEPISLDDLEEAVLRPKRTDMINRKMFVTTGIKTKTLLSSIEHIACQYLKSNNYANE